MNIHNVIKLNEAEQAAMQASGDQRWAAAVDRTMESHALVAPLFAAAAKESTGEGVASVFRNASDDQLLEVARLTSLAMAELTKLMQARSLEQMREEAGL